jgi:hypothetical protein
MRVCVVLVGAIVMGALTGCGPASGPGSEPTPFSHRDGVPFLFGDDAASLMKQLGALGAGPDRDPAIQSDLSVGQTQCNDALPWCGVTLIDGKHRDLWVREASELANLLYGAGVADDQPVTTPVGDFTGYSVSRIDCWWPDGWDAVCWFVPTGS